MCYIRIFQSLLQLLEWSAAKGSICFPCGREITTMKLEVEIPDKYGDKLEELEAVDPTIRDQIEIEVLPQVLRLINDAHRQVQQQDPDPEHRRSDSE